jgi:GMP synthase-like glutamine amidotransferase
MIKKPILAIIDPYMIAPALQCYERIRSLSGLECRYYQPTRLGNQRLKTDDNQAYVILGSASHVFQKYDWQTELAEITLKELMKDKPVLGICFGHQLICSALGSTVEFYNSKQDKLTGVRKVELTQNFLGLSSQTVLNLAVTHRQVVAKLSLELEEVAQGLNPKLPNDIVRHRKYPFVGTQPHIEVNPTFATNEAFISNASEYEKSYLDGGKLIKAFFETYNL